MASVSLLKYAQFFSPCLIDIFTNSKKPAWFSIHFIYISTRKRLYDSWYQMLLVRRDIRQLYYENGVHEHVGKFSSKVPFCVQYLTVSPLILYPLTQPNSILSLYWNICLYGSVVIWRGRVTIGRWHIMALNEESNI